MQISLPNGFVERMSERVGRSQLNTRYGRRKEGAPREPRTVDLAAKNDRRDEARDENDPFRGRLIDLTT